MTGTEVATMDPAEMKRMQELMGVTASEGGGGTPLLKINSLDEDDNGKELPKGAFFLNKSPLAYAKTVKIRVLGVHYQYLEYDPDANKLVNRTIIVPNMQQEMLDEKGTTRCGMPMGKSKMDPDMKERFKNVTAFRQLRGVVSYTGKDVDGNDVTHENEPFLMSLKGSNFMPFEDDVMKKLPFGRAVWDFDINVSLERHKNGSVIYYVARFQPDFTTPLPFSQEIGESINEVASQIRSQNEKIRDKHEAAIRERQTNAGVLDALGDDLEQDVA
jgi:hypothetical protein